MKIESGDWAGIISAVGGLLTVLGALFTKVWMMMRRIDSSHAELKGEISELRQASGTFKTPPMPPPDAT